MTRNYIYKIFQQSEWENLQDTHVFKGSSVDMADGFIHLSCAHQLQGTLDKHYTEGRDVIIAEIESNTVQDHLKFEISRGGEAFPHLYADLALVDITQYWPLSPDSQGRYEVGTILHSE